MRGRKACSSNLRRSGSHPVLGQKLAVPISSSSWTTEARQAEARRPVPGWRAPSGGEAAGARLASAERRRGGWVAARGRVGWIDSDPRVSTVRSSLPLCLLGSARTEPWAKLRSGASSQTGQTAPFAGLSVRTAASPDLNARRAHRPAQPQRGRTGGGRHAGRCGAGMEFSYLAVITSGDGLIDPRSPTLGCE